MGSTWNSRLCLSVFGQSHAPAVGMTLDGVPAGETIDIDALNSFMTRRAPGRFPWATARREDDIPEILSGIVNGVTCGAPITAIIRNMNAHSGAYKNIEDIPRPGHADYTAHMKYSGFHDVSGGGHFSGRLTAATCLAGGVCLQILRRRNITIGAHISSIENIFAQPFDALNIDESTLRALWDKDFPVLKDCDAAIMIKRVEQAKNDGDSLGGVITCAVVGLPPGLGDPMFGGMENRISSLVFGIPAVKGIEFGAGFRAAQMRGSENNDAFFMDGGMVKTRTNNHGGILGGITSGMPLIFHTAIKPTPSIAKEQESVSLSRRETAKLEVRGRHDPCIVPRAVPCVEAAAAVAVYDAILEQEGARI